MSKSRKESDETRYRRYCNWCRSLGIAPAEYRDWRGTVQTIPELKGI